MDEKNFLDSFIQIRQLAEREEKQKTLSTLLAHCFEGRIVWESQTGVLLAADIFPSGGGAFFEPDLCIHPYGW